MCWKGVQRWSAAIYATDGEEKARAFLAELRQRAPDDKELAGRVSYHVNWVARELERKGRHADALATVERHKALLKQERDFESLVHGVYDRWADSFLSKNPKDWQAAVDRYTEGMKQYPKNGDLRHNAIVTWDRWAHTFSDKKDWDDAIRIYKMGLLAIPDARELKEGLEYCEKKRK